MLAGKGHAYPTITAALRAAPPGETVLVEPGVYKEHLVIEKPVALRAKSGGVTIDGGGKGNVIIINAPDVIIQGLKITGSSPKVNPFRRWGDAGIRVNGPRAQLMGNEIFGNTWGVLVFRANEAKIARNKVHDNKGNGILLLGSGDSAIRNNEVFGNALAGIFVAETYLGASGDIQETGKLKVENLAPATNVLVEDNKVRSNGGYGIVLSGVAESVVLNNVVSQTRFLSAKFYGRWDLFAQKNPGKMNPRAVEAGKKMQGTGILISCGSERNLVRSNSSRENAGPGMVLYISNKNILRDNTLRDNRDGVIIYGSQANRIFNNLVIDNRNHGIAIARLWKDTEALASGDNRIWRNDLSGNGTNAWDASAITRGKTAMYRTRSRFKVGHLGKILRERLRKEGKSRKAIDAQVRMLEHNLRILDISRRPNRWDDGRLGNHHDDFDEPREGFRDHDGDGVGERARRIPGGDAKDHHPLADARLCQPERPCDPSRAGVTGEKRRQ